MSVWLDVLPALVVTGLVCTAPGFVAAWLVGLRGVAALGTAAPLSVAALAAGAVVLQVVGLSWDVLGIVVTVLLLWVAALVAGLLLRRPSAPRPVEDARGVWLAGAAGAVVGLVQVVVASAWGMGRPDGLPSQPDTMYHLGAVRRVLETGDGSSLHAAALTSPSGSGFYPAAFHDIAAAVAQLTGSSVLVACNLTAIVAAAVVWPTGCVLLARQVLGAGRWPLVLAGLLSASFTSFPFWLMGYGVLWPNLLGYALLPAALAAAVSVTGLARADVLGRGRALVLLPVVAVGVGLAHPNAFMSGALFGFVMAGWALVRWLRAGSLRRRPVLAAAAVLAYVAVPLLWLAGPFVVPLMKRVASLNTSINEETPARAFGEVVLNSPRQWPAQYLLSALLVAGLVLLARRRRTAWTVGVYAVTVVLAVVSMAFHGRIGSVITGYWYNNSPRLVALVPVTGVLLATASLLALTRRLQGRGGGWRRYVAPLAVVAVLLALTSGNYLSENAERVRTYYQPQRTDRVLLTRTEAAALQRIARYIPQGSAVAGDPWDGTSLLYALTGREVVFASEKAANTPDRQIIAHHLDEAAQSPAVCRAVKALDVGYVLLGGTPFTPRVHGTRTFEGVTGVSKAPGFEQVAHEGAFRLYRVTACGRG